MTIKSLKINNKSVSSDSKIEKATSKSRNKNLYFGLGGMSIILFIMVFAFAFLFFKYIEARNEVDDLSVLGTNDRQEREVQKSIESLSSIMLLPEDDPTIATIIDVDLLKVENNDFYKDSQNGDKLFIFRENNLALIFRSEDKKIINIASVQIDSTEESDALQNE